MKLFNYQYHASPHIIYATHTIIGRIYIIFIALSFALYILKNDFKSSSLTSNHKSSDFGHKRLIILCFLLALLCFL
ncbi:hypothetical protein [Helicobacter fennelliae]